MKTILKNMIRILSSVLQWMWFIPFFICYVIAVNAVQICIKVKTKFGIKVGIVEKVESFLICLK